MIMGVLPGSMTFEAHIENGTLKHMVLMMIMFPENEVYTGFQFYVDGDMLQERGFFIEVGALDGERSSNTIWLEHKKHWTGLLIEMDPYFYTMLKGHTRNAWSINCCLSPKNYTTMVRLYFIVPSELVAQWIPDLLLHICVLSIYAL